MRLLGKWFGRMLLLFVLVIGALWLFGPYERVSTDARFDESALGDDLAAYLSAREAAYDDLRPGDQKQIIWAGEARARTSQVVVYVHGFSASSEELRPVPDRVAEALGANLYFTRLAGHGRSGAAMGEPSMGDWMQDIGETLAIARRLGDEIIVISTSTGGTLMAEAALQSELMEGVKGLVFVSPNFGINDPSAGLLTLPAARYILPRLIGETRTWTPRSDAQAAHWTTSYPSVAVFPMAALVQHAVAQDYSEVLTPSMFYFSEHDRVVDASITQEIVTRWGGAPRVILVPEAQTAGGNHHVLAGDIVTPENTDAAVAAMLKWINGL